MFDLATIHNKIIENLQKQKSLEAVTCDNAKQNRNSCPHEYIAYKLHYTMLRIGPKQFSTNASTNRARNQFE